MSVTKHQQPSSIEDLMERIKKGFHLPPEDSHDPDSGARIRVATYPFDQGKNRIVGTFNTTGIRAYRLHHAPTPLSLQRHKVTWLATIHVN